MQGKVVAYGKNQQISPVLDQLINYSYTLAYQLKLDKKYSCFHFFFHMQQFLEKVQRSVLVNVSLMLPKAPFTRVRTNF